MTIKEVEELTGLTRSNIRFYEKESLISPNRNVSNGYREYSQEDVRTIKKIAYLRTLGISVEDIRRLSNKEKTLQEVIKIQNQNLDNQITELKTAKKMCERILSSAEKIEYETLDVEKYVADVKEYFTENKCVIKPDSLSFIYLWGGNLIWGLLTAASLLIAVLSFTSLPAEIPVQWSGGTASSFADKKFIFVFPAACVMIRLMLRPMIWRWLRVNFNYFDVDAVTDYLTNDACFIALSVQVFTILFVNGILKHITSVLALDIGVMMGILVLAVYKRRKKTE